MAESISTLSVVIFSSAATKVEKLIIAPPSVDGGYDSLLLLRGTLSLLKSFVLCSAAQGEDGGTHASFIAIGVVSILRVKIAFNVVGGYEVRGSWTVMAVGLSAHACSPRVSS